MRKMDEMEKSIALQSMRWSWGFGIISLALYNLYLTATAGETNIITLIIMLGMFITQRGIYYFKLQQANEDKSFWRFVVLIVLFFVILLGLVYVIGVL